LFSTSPPSWLDWRSASQRRNSAWRGNNLKGMKAGLRRGSYVSTYLSQNNTTSEAHAMRSDSSTPLTVVLLVAPSRLPTFSTASADQRCGKVSDGGSKPWFSPIGFTLRILQPIK